MFFVPTEEKAILIACIRGKKYVETVYYLSFFADGRIANHKMHFIDTKQWKGTQLGIFSMLSLEQACEEWPYMAGLIRTTHATSTRCQQHDLR